MDLLLKSPYTMIMVISYNNYYSIYQFFVIRFTSIDIAISELQLYFTAGSYEVEEGNSIEVCVGTDGEDLRRPVDLYLSSEDSTATGQHILLCLYLLL